jgi:putative membrane protein
MFELFAAAGDEAMTFSQSMQVTGVEFIRSPLFGVTGLLLLLLGYWLFDLITPRLDVQKELCDKNVAVGMVVSALILGTAFIVGWVVR